MILVSKHMFLCMEHPVLGSTIKCYMAAILKFKMAALNINIVNKIIHFSPIIMTVWPKYLYFITNLKSVTDAIILEI